MDTLEIPDCGPGAGAGRQVAINDDVDRAAGNLDSELRFSPEGSGVYYISAGSYSANPNQDNWGDYRLTVFTLGSADVIEGSNGADEMVGTGDDDEFEGGPGADSIHGGPGSDLVLYLWSDDAVVVRLHTVLEQRGKGGDAEGDTYNSETYAVTGEDGTTREFEVPDIWNLIGSEHNDVLAGDFRENWINGLGGDDLLYGGPDGGPDILVGGDGDDKVYGGTITLQDYNEADLMDAHFAFYMDDSATAA